MTYTEMQGRFTPEALQFASVNERFDNEPEFVRNTRIAYCEVYKQLESLIDKELYLRYREIAITHLEISLMFAIKAYYNNL